MSAMTWRERIETARKHEEKWRDRAERTAKLFRDERENDRGGQRRSNIFWATVQTLKPAIYSRRPIPHVPRRRGARNDPVAAAAAELIERRLTQFVERDDVDRAFRAARDDVLINGRGWIWFGLGGSDAAPRVTVEPVLKDDQIVAPEQRWERVPWLGRRHHLDQRRAEAEFGGKIAGALTYDVRSGPDQSARVDQARERRYATVWEIWDRDSGKRLYLEAGRGGVLREDVDPLALVDFFPCPRPVYAVERTDSLVPIPEYALYQDHAQELDELTDRISHLTRMVKVVGLYPKHAGGTVVKLGDLKDGEYAPSDLLMQFDGKARDLLHELPFESAAKALQILSARREQLVAHIYEITGVSDIQRGVTDPNETLGAQQLKSQFGSLRVAPRQREFQRFVRDGLRIAAEISVELFEPDYLIAESGVEIAVGQAIGPDGVPVMLNADGRPTQAPPLDAVMDLLRRDQERQFAIDIETDSTVFADQTAEKEKIAEVSRTVMENVMALVPAVQQGAIPPDFAREMIRLQIGPMSGARAVEQTLDRLFADDAQAQQVAQMGQQLQQAQAQLQQAAAENEQLRVAADEVQAEVEKQKVRVAGKIQETMATQRIKAQAEIARGAQMEMDLGAVQVV